MSFFSKWQTHDDGIKSPQTELKQPSLQTTSHVTDTHSVDSINLLSWKVRGSKNSHLLNVKSY